MTPPAPSPLRALLFDLDGTLIDTKALYLECYRRALEPALGRAPSDQEILALKPRAETRFLRERLPAAADAARCMDIFYEHYRALHAERFGGIYPGVPELLERLRARGLKLGLVTGKSRRAWEITAAEVALGPFDVEVLDDDVAEPKPHPGGILRALEVLGVPPDAAAYVGDSLGDVLAARAAGVLPGAALWSIRRSAERRARFAARAQAEGARLLERVEEVERLVG